MIGVHPPVVTISATGSELYERVIYPVPPRPPLLAPSGLSLAGPPAPPEPSDPFAPGALVLATPTAPDASVLAPPLPPALTVPAAPSPTLPLLNPVPPATV